MPKVHGGVPLVWDDSLAPAFAAGSGAAAPSYTTDFIAATGAGGSDANELRLPTFTASSNDRVYTTTQIFHDLHIPSSGNITFKPHVHWTFISEPTDSRTVIWELNYVYAKNDATFASSVSPLVASTYTTTGSAEVRKHIITALGDISIAAANCGPSMIFICSLKLKSTSTVDAGIVGLLSFDIHYQKGPAGTDSEYS